MTPAVALGMCFAVLFGAGVGSWLSYKVVAIGFKQSREARLNLLRILHDAHPDEYHSVCKPHL